MDNSLNPGAGNGAASPDAALPSKSGWWDVIKKLARNPYAHPSCAAAFGIMGTDVMVSSLHDVAEKVLPFTPEAVASTTTCIAAMSIGLSGMTIAKDSFAVAKILKDKVGDRYAEYQANKALPGPGLTLSGVLAAAAASVKVMKKSANEAAKTFAEPFAEGYRNSRSEPVFAKETITITKNMLYDAAAGGRNGEKASKNAMTMFTGLAAKFTGIKTASAGTVIAILSRNSSDPLAHAAAFSAVGAFVAGAIAASVHRARTKLEQGANTEGAIIESGMDLASILGTAGALGVSVAAPRVKGVVRSAVEEAVDAYGDHPAVEDVMETARSYIQKAMEAGIDRTTAVQDFMSTHAPALIRAHDAATESMSKAFVAAKEAGEFVKKHTVESKLLESTLGEFAKEQLGEKVPEILREKIEAEIERGAEIKEESTASVMFKRKIGAAFGKLVDIGPQVVEYLATGLPPLALAMPLVPAVATTRSHQNPIGYGFGGLGVRHGAHGHRSQNHLR